MRNWFMLLFFIVAPISTAADNLKKPSAEWCGVDEDKPPLRVFADPQGANVWREFKNVKEIPQMNSDSQFFADVWSDSHGGMVVMIGDYEPDWAVYTDYCFDKNGKAVRLRFRLRTAWGFGFRQEGPIIGEKLISQSAEFFDTANEKTIPKPEVAGDIPEALQPHVYTEKKQLPFFKLLEHRNTGN